MKEVEARVRVRIERQHPFLVGFRATVGLAQLLWLLVVEHRDVVFICAVVHRLQGPQVRICRVPSINRICEVISLRIQIDAFQPAILFNLDVPINCSPLAVNA